MSGVVKIEITESAETLKKLLINASTPQEKERIQTIYWLKTQTVKTVKEIAIMLGRNRVTIQKWLRKYRTGGINLLLESKKNKGGRPRAIPALALAKLKEELQNPEGFSSYSEIQLWLRTCFEIDVAYRTVHELVRYKLKAKLKVPRPLHIKQNKEAKENFKKN
jgi:transposase